ncbi:MAG: ClbS/DfsB family four-helix bundle protein [Saprospiraceae bacterium]|nr:ClbS/DfsB family four-helix bundle protein [Saprospiraceae bacterium]
MPRPKTKNELLDLSEENYGRLNDFVDNLSDAEKHREFPNGYLNRNIRDVLAHLHEWHLMMLQWYEIGMLGEKPDIPAKGYTWKTIKELNQLIQKKYEHIPLENVRELLGQSHESIMQLIHSHTDVELFEKKKYHWTGSTSLGAYLVSSTSSHYDWAWKLIRKCLK